MLKILQSHLNGEKYSIINCSRQKSTQIEKTIEAFKSDKNKIIFIQKNPLNEKFFQNLDPKTVGNDEYYIYYNGNYATWLDESDISKTILLSFLDQSGEVSTTPLVTTIPNTCKVIRIPKQPSMQSTQSTQSTFTSNTKTNQMNDLKISVVPNIKIV